MNSVLGSGSTFYFTIPFTPSDNLEVIDEQDDDDFSPSPFIHQEDEDKDTLGLTNKLFPNHNVLILSNSQDNLDFFKVHFPIWGLTPHLVTSSEIDTFSIDSKNFDLLILDFLSIPMEVLERYHDQIFSLPCIVLSKHKILDQTSTIFSSHPDVIISLYPLRRASIVNSIQSLLRKKLNSLPLIPSSPPPLQSKKKEENSIPFLASTFPLNLLIAEDDPINQAFIQKALQKMGYEPKFASNGKEALLSLSQEKERFNLVILDLCMPVMDGNETLQEILKRFPQKDQRPSIILMSATEPSLLKNNTNFEYFDGVLEKPLKMEKFVETLQKCSLSLQKV